MKIWLLIGFALIAWITYDLMKGEVWLHRKVKRSEEPVLYWAGIAFYTLLAITCF